MDIETIVAHFQTKVGIPAHLTYRTDKKRNMGRVYGFKNDRFDSIAIQVIKDTITFSLVMQNRLVFVPKFGYIGVTKFTNQSDAAAELLRLSRLR